MVLDHTINRRRVLEGVAAGSTAGLAGCFGGDSPTDSSSDDSDGDESVEFTNWSWGPNIPPLEAAIEQWEEDNPHTVNVEEISSDPEVWTQALQVQDGLPGIGLMLFSTYRASAQAGGLANINDIILPNLDQFIDAAISATHVNGDFYGFPHSINPVVMIYNRNMFEEAGIGANPDDVFDELQTYDDLIQAGEQMQSELGADILLHGSENYWIPNGLRSQFRGGFYNTDGEFQFDSQENIDMFKTLKDLQPYSANYNPEGGNHWDEFRNENIASFIVPGWFIGTIQTELDEMSGDFRVLQLPAPEQGGPRGATEGGAPEAIPAAKSEEVKRAAKDFGEFRHMSEESYNMKLDNFIFAANSVDDPEVYEQEVEYFGGQTVFDQLGPTLEASPQQEDPPSPEILSMYEEAYRQIMQEDADIEETLSSTHDEMVEVLNEEQMTRMTLEEVKAQA